MGRGLVGRLVRISESGEADPVVDGILGIEDVIERQCVIGGPNLYETGPAVVEEVEVIMSVTNLDVVEIVSMAIEAERAGHKFYIRAAEMTSDPKGKQMFNRLANDELAHTYWLMTVRQSLVRTGSCEVCKGDIEKIRVPITDPAEYLFPVVGTTGEASKADQGELEAIQQGIETEKKAAAFYSEAADRVDDPDAKGLFRKLADWEDEHRRLLEAEYDYLTNTGFYFGIAEFELEGPDYLSWWRR